MTVPLVGRIHWPSVILTVLFMYFALPWIMGMVGGMGASKSKKAA